MDFKAVLHKPGIWKINTNTDNLYQDKKLDNLSSTGLLIYKEHCSHTHVTDGKFLENVSKIRNTKFNYDIDEKTAMYIGFEESIVNVLNYLGSEEKLTEDYLGQFLNQSCLNIKSWLNIDTSDIRLDGIYGEKIVGSGLRGAHFLLINKEKEFEIRQALGEKYNIIEVEL